MAPTAKVQRRRKLPVVLKDTHFRDVRKFVTIAELIDMLEAAGLPRYTRMTVHRWIAQGWLYGQKAGEGKSMIVLIHRDAAVRFVQFMRARQGGEHLGLLQAAAYLGEKLGRPGPLSHNTVRSWVLRGLLFPVNPSASTAKFTRAELDAFAEWFETVKVRRYGQWSVPYNAERPLWQDDAEED